MDKNLKSYEKYKTDIITYMFMIITQAVMVLVLDISNIEGTNIIAAFTLLLFIMIYNIIKSKEVQAKIALQKFINDTLSHYICKNISLSEDKCLHKSAMINNILQTLRS